MNVRVLKWLKLFQSSGQRKIKAMTDKKDNQEHTQSEEERIAAWKAERQRVAEEQKQERIRLKQEEREKAAEQRKLEAEAKKQERIRLKQEEREQAAEQRKLEAEAQKQERIRQKQEEREKQQKEQEEKLTQQVQSRIPSLDEVKAQDVRFEEHKRKIKQSKIKLFSVLVLIPTLFVLFYQSFISTPLYSATAVISVSSKQSESSSSFGGVPALGNTVNPDVYSSYAYLTSTSLLRALDKESNIVQRLSSDEVDPITRIRSWLGSSETAQLKRFIESSIDIQSGLITITVFDYQKEQAIKNINTIINLVDKQTSLLSKELFESQIESAVMAVEEARLGVIEATQVLTQIQLESSIQDPELYLASIYRDIDTMSAERLQLLNQIKRNEINGTGNSPLTNSLRLEVKELDKRITSTRNNLIETEDTESFASLLKRFNQARKESQIANEILNKSLQALADIEKDAALGKNLIQRVVPAQASESTTHPKVLKTTFIAFLLTYSLFLIVRVVLKLD